MDSKTLELPYTAILLVAGQGSRISALTNDPKVLLPIGKESILERHFRIWKEIGIKNIILVVGYEASKITEVADRYKDTFNIRYMLNEDYNNLGNTHSLYLGIKEANAPVLIFDADLVYKREILEDFTNDTNQDQIIVGKGNLDDIECAKALVDKNNFIRKTVDKRAVTKEELNDYSFSGEALGILKFSKETTEYLTRAAEQFLSVESNLNLNWEHLMNEFLLTKNISSKMSISETWVEIDTPEDYQEALSLFTKSELK